MNKNNLSLQHRPVTISKAASVFVYSWVPTFPSSELTSTQLSFPKWCQKMMQNPPVVVHVYTGLNKQGVTAKQEQRSDV